MAWYESFIGGIVEIFGLFADSIMALIGQIALNTSQTRPVVTWDLSMVVCEVRNGQD